MPPLSLNVQELIAQLDVDLAQADDLAKVTEARQRATVVAGVGDQLIDHFVTRARAAGASWNQIGAALGVTKQAAQQRWMAPTFERFTDRARQAVVGAQERARELRHSIVEPEHVILALLAVHEGIAAKVMTGPGRSRRTIERRIGESLPPGTDAPPTHIPFGTEPKQAMKLALDQALEFGQNYIGTEHLLLGLLRVPDGRGAGLLSELGVTYDSARAGVMKEIDAYVAAKRETG
ncbi:MAG TPA: Clp protease N-terminal domain-containing protein [Jatrophihabitantaceae bacterium]|jgi:hypothetical protein